MFSLPRLPAGDYRLTVGPDTAKGWVMVGIARDQFALRTQQLPVAPIDLRFPLPVRGLLVGGDEDGRRSVRSLLVEPRRIFRPAERLTNQIARRAVRSAGNSTVFFLDERSFPEPEAFWVGGSRESTIVIQPDVAGPAATLRLRNGPVEQPRHARDRGRQAPVCGDGPGRGAAVRACRSMPRRGGVRAAPGGERRVPPVGARSRQPRSAASSACVRSNPPRTSRRRRNTAPSSSDRPRPARPGRRPSTSGTRPARRSCR